MKSSAVIALFVLGVIVNGCNRSYPSFSEKLLDSTLIRDCWMKTTGDLNGDKKADLIAGGHASGGIWVWYAPDLRKEQITSMLGASTDAEAADVDNDGDNDLVAIFENKLVWFSNPGWEMKIISDTLVTHDIIVADFDGDKLVDIAARNQGEFGYSGKDLFLLKQLSPERWSLSEIPIMDGEGLDWVDMNGDGRTDILVNGSWFENTGDILSWKEHKFTDTWVWKNAFICNADLNKDGLTDIVMSPSELKGSKYRISWFEAPAGKNEIFKEHIVVPEIETVVHFIGAADFNNDGRTDLTYARMTQGDDPDEVVILYNLGNEKWNRQVISTGGSHSMRIIDIDNDGDPDLFGANWNDNSVKIWINNQP